MKYYINTPYGYVTDDSDGYLGFDTYVEAVNYLSKLRKNFQNTESLKDIRLTIIYR